MDIVAVYYNTKTGRYLLCEKGNPLLLSNDPIDGERHVEFHSMPADVQQKISLLALLDPAKRNTEYVKVPGVGKVRWSKVKSRKNYVYYKLD